MTGRPTAARRSARIRARARGFLARCRDNASCRRRQPPSQGHYTRPARQRRGGPARQPGGAKRELIGRVCRAALSVRPIAGHHNGPVRKNSATARAVAGSPVLWPHPVQIAICSSAESSLSTRTGPICAVTFAISLSAASSPPAAAAAGPARDLVSPYGDRLRELSDLPAPHTVLCTSGTDRAATAALAPALPARPAGAVDPVPTPVLTHPSHQPGADSTRSGPATGGHIGPAGVPLCRPSLTADRRLIRPVVALCSNSSDGGGTPARPAEADVARCPLKDPQPPNIWATSHYNRVTLLLECA